MRKKSELPREWTNTGACITAARNGAASAFKAAMVSCGFVATIKKKVLKK